MKTNSFVTDIFVLEKTPKSSQRGMSNESHFYPELQQTEVVSINDLLMESLLSHEG